MLCSRFKISCFTVRYFKFQFMPSTHCVWVIFFNPQTQGCLLSLIICDSFNSFQWSFIVNSVVNFCIDGICRCYLSQPRGSSVPKHGDLFPPGWGNRFIWSEKFIYSSFLFTNDEKAEHEMDSLTGVVWGVMGAVDWTIMVKIKPAFNLSFDLHWALY